MFSICLISLKFTQHFVWNMVFADKSVSICAVVSSEFSSKELSFLMLIYYYLPEPPFRPSLVYAYYLERTWLIRCPVKTYGKRKQLIRRIWIGCQWQSWYVCKLSYLKSIGRHIWQRWTAIMVIYIDGILTDWNGPVSLKVALWWYIWKILTW